MSQAGSTSRAHDYVIVGAGSAGAVLAARLTEDPGVRVLLLEAGPEAEADEISIPAAFPALFKTRWDWNYDHHRAEAAAQPAGLLAADEGARWLLLDERDDLHPWASPPTTTPGATSTAPPAGGTTTSCPTSSAPRATPASARRTTARTDRCTSRTGATPTS